MAQLYIHKDKHKKCNIKWVINIWNYELIITMNCFKLKYQNTILNDYFALIG